MPIVLVRVDDRLVHGQIIEGWIPTTKAEELIIANDSLADDSLQQMIMHSALPFSVALMVDSVERIASFLRANLHNESRRIVLVDRPRDALRLIQAGVKFEHLNLGNLRTGELAVCLSKSVVVGIETLLDLKSIMDEGVRVTIQSVPFEKPLELLDILRYMPRNESG